MQTKEQAETARQIKKEAEHASLAEKSERLIKMPQLKQMLGLSRSQIYKLIAEGILKPPIKIGRSSLFVEREAQAFIAGKIAERDAL